MTFFKVHKERADAMKLKNPFRKGTPNYEAYKEGFYRGIEYQLWRDLNK